MVKVLIVFPERHISKYLEIFYSKFLEISIKNIKHLALLNRSYLFFSDKVIGKVIAGLHKFKQTKEKYVQKRSFKGKHVTLHPGK